MQPRSLMVFGKKIPVKYVRGLKKAGVLGKYDDKVIYIDAQIEGEELTVTLIHEMLHATCDRLHIKLDEFQEELIVDTFAQVIYENFLSE